MIIKKFKLYEQEVSDKIKLAERIYKFIDKYAAIKPDWNKEYDDEDDKFTSPDAAMLKCFADCLIKGIIMDRCWSEWGNGGYKPYSSKEGRKEHDEIMEEVYKMIKSKK